MRKHLFLLIALITSAVMAFGGTTVYAAITGGNTLDDAPLIYQAETQITLENNYLTVFKFVPAENATYTIKSLPGSGGFDTYAELWNSAGEKILYRDDDDGFDFIITYALTANQTYYLKMYDYDMRVTCTLSITGGALVQPPPSITIDNSTANQTFGSSSDISISGTVSDINNFDVDVSAAIDGVSKNTTVAGGNGSWSLTWDVDADGIAEGTYTNVVFTANSGASSTAAYTGSLAVDLTSPAAPEIFRIDGKLISDDSTYVYTKNDKPMRIEGYSERNSTVEIFIDSVSVGTTTPTVVMGDGRGSWEFDYTGVAFPVGDYSITAAVTDAAGNTGDESIAYTVIIDKTKPDPPTITGIYDDTGLSASDNITNDNIPAFYGTAEEWSYVELFDSMNNPLGTVQADGSGNWSNEVEYNLSGEYSVMAVARDRASNQSDASDVFTFKLDRTSPTTAITSTKSNITNTSPIDITITFSEAVTGFDIGDITVGNATAGSLAAVNETTYTAQITPAGQGEVTVDVAGGVCQDIAGNNNTAAAGFAINYDSVAPTVEISCAQGSFTNTSLVDIIFTFSEPVTGFDFTDINISSISSISVNTVNAATYIAQVTLSGQGPHTVIISAGRCKDTARNNNIAAEEYVITYDSVAPDAPSITGIADDTGVAGDSTTYDNTIVLSGTAEANSTVEIFRDGVSIGAAAANGEGNWSFDYTGTALADGAYGFTARATDEAGNTGDLSAVTEVHIDAAAPSVSSVTLPANGIYIPGQNLDFTVNFDEVVYVSGGTPYIPVTLNTGGTVNASYISGSGTGSLVFRYTVQTGNLDTDGIALGMAVSNSGASIADEAGNNANLALNSVGSTVSVLVDGIAPEVSISSMKSSPTGESPVDITITFSEPVTGFTAEDLTMTNISDISFNSLSSTDYFIEVIPAGPGDVTVDIASGVCSDNAGNDNTAADQFVITYNPGAQKAEASADTLTPLVGSNIEITLAVKDALGNIDASFDGNKDVAISGVEAAQDGSYGSFNGTALDSDSEDRGQIIQVTFTDGAASAGLVLNKAVVQTIKFNISGLADTNTNTINITPAAGTVSSMTVGTDISAPSSNGGQFARQPVMALVDEYGNACTGDNSTQVTASKKDAGDWTLTGTRTRTATNGLVTFTGLGTLNMAQVDNAQLAFNAAGLAEVTSGMVTLPAPNAPSTPVIQSVSSGDGCASIIWSSIPEADGYKIYKSTTSGTYGDAPVSVSSSVYSHEAEGLTNGTTYYFVVKGFNGGGDSPASNEVSAMPQVAAPGAPQLLSADAGGGQVSITWTPVTGSTSYNVYVSSTSNTYSSVYESVYGHSNTCDVTGLINGTTYYFVVSAVNPGGESGHSNQISAVPVAVPGAPSNVAAEAGSGQAVITFTAPADNGGSPITGYIVTSHPGNIEVSGNSSPVTVTGLTNGTSYTFTVRAVNSAGEGPDSAASSAVTPSAPSSGGSSGGSNNSSNQNTQTNSDENSLDIYVNGRSESAATVTNTVVEGRTVTTVALDGEKVESQLESEGRNAVVTIPVNDSSDVVVGTLTGQTVKNMEEKDAVLEVKTGNVTYTLPATQIDINSVSGQMGQQVELKDITVSVKISEPPQDSVRIVEDTANKNNYQLVVKPVEFEITCSSGGRTVEVSKFKAYVERMIAIPEGVDPSKVTTAVVLNDDGTFSHVPTSIVIVDGKPYARINSLTNSTYTVIWSPRRFKDMEGHWAKEAVNDMGSRLIISGLGDGSFEPGRDITRAEFAAIVVKGLGLMRPESGRDVFGDVNKNSWYYDAVSIAHEYGLISGYGDGSFGPNDKITREQAMAVTARAMGIAGLKSGLSRTQAESVLSAFGDYDQSSAWAREGMAACVEAGIISGKGGKLLAPKDKITRAEVAVIVRRLLQKANLI